MITTNSIKPTGPGEEKKLNHVTTGELVQPPPEAAATRGTDPAKMVTTHNIEEYMAKNAGADDKPGTLPAEDDIPVQAPAPKKQRGRPKKADRG